RRADQIIHCGINDDELLAAASLSVKDAGQKDAGVSRDIPSWLQRDAVRLALEQRQQCASVLGDRQRLVRVFVIDGKTAAHVEPFNFVASRSQPIDQRRRLSYRIDVRLNFVDGRTDVQVQAADAKVF